MKFIFYMACLVFIAGCSSKPHIIVKTNISASTPQNIYIVNHGAHTGIAVPAGIIQSRSPVLSRRFPNTPYLEFGWGDRDFYQSEEITSSLTMQAILWPTDSAMLVIALNEKPDQYYPNIKVKKLCLTPNQYALLISFLEHSFQKDNTGKIISSKEGFYGNSHFYKGEGIYYLLNTCNNWTAKALKSAGLAIQPAFKLTSGSIMSFLSEQDPNSGLCDAND